MRRLIDEEHSIVYVFNPYLVSIMVWRFLPDLKKVARFRVKWFKKYDYEKRYYPFFNSNPRGPWINEDHYEDLLP